MIERYLMANATFTSNTFSGGSSSDRIYLDNLASASGSPLTPIMENVCRKTSAGTSNYSLDSSSFSDLSGGLLILNNSSNGQFAMLKLDGDVVIGHADDPTGRDLTLVIGPYDFMTSFSNPKVLIFEETAKIVCESRSYYVIKHIHTSTNYTTEPGARSVIEIRNNNTDSELRIKLYSGPVTETDWSLGSNLKRSGTEIVNWRITDDVSVREFEWVSGYIDWRPYTGFAPPTKGVFKSSTGIKWLSRGNAVFSNTSPLVFGNSDDSFVLSLGSRSNDYLLIGIHASSGIDQRIVFLNLDGPDLESKLGQYVNHSASSGRIENHIVVDYKLIDDFGDPVSDGLIVLHSRTPEYSSPSTSGTASVSFPSSNNITIESTSDSDGEGVLGTDDGDLDTAICIEAFGRRILVSGGNYDGAYASASNYRAAYAKYNSLEYDVFSFGKDIITGISFDVSISGASGAGKQNIGRVKLSNDNNLTVDLDSEVPTSASDFDDAYNMLHKYSIDNRTSALGEGSAGIFDIGSYDLSLEREIGFEEYLPTTGLSVSGTLSNFTSGIKTITSISVGDTVFSNLTSVKDSDEVITVTADELHSSITSTVSGSTGVYNLSFSTGEGPSSSEQLSIKYEVEGPVLVNNDSIRLRTDETIEPGSKITRIVTSGDLTVGDDIQVNGGIADNSGILIRIGNLPAGHDAVAAAWLKSQGIDRRSNLITGQVNDDDDSTSIIIKLLLDTEYYVVADAVSYRRSAVFPLDTTSQTTLNIGLSLIRDFAGNDLIPSTLTVDEQAQAYLIEYDTDSDKIVFSTSSPTTAIGDDNDDESGTYNGALTYVSGSAKGVALGDDVMYIVFSSGTQTKILVLGRDVDGVTALTNHSEGHFNFNTITGKTPVDCELSHDGDYLLVITNTSDVYYYLVNDTSSAYYGIRSSGFVSISDSTSHIWPVSSNVTDLAIESSTSAFVKSGDKVYKVIINSVTSWTYDPTWGVLTVNEDSRISYNGNDEILVIENDGIVSRYRTSDHALHAVGFSVENPTDAMEVTGISTKDNNMILVYNRSSNNGRVPIKSTYHKNSDDAVTNFDFKSAARVIEIGQSSEEAQANPYVAVFSPGSIQFESGSSRTIQADPDNDYRFIPDLSSFQLKRIGAESISEYVDFTQGPIIVDDGPPTNVTVTTSSSSSNVSVNTDDIVDAMEASGTALAVVKSSVEHTSYGLSAIKDEIDNVPSVTDMVDGVLNADISGDSDSDNRTLAETLSDLQSDLSDLQNDVTNLPSASDISDEVLNADADNDSTGIQTLSDLLRTIITKIATLQTGVNDLPELGTLLTSFGISSSDTDTVIDKLNTLKSEIDSLPEVNDIVEGVFDFDLDSVSDGLQSISDRLRVIVQGVSTLQNNLDSLNVDVDFPTVSEIVTGLVNEILGDDSDSSSLKETLLEIKNRNIPTVSDISSEMLTALGVTSSSNTTIVKTLKIIKSMVGDIPGSITDEIFNRDVEPLINFRNALRIILAILAGSTNVREADSSGEDPTVSFKRLGTDQVVVESTVTGDGERTSQVIS